MVRDAIIKRRASAGPSSLDADGWSRILMSGNFGTSEEDLRKAIADMTKRLCQLAVKRLFMPFMKCSIKKALRQY